MKNNEHQILRKQLKKQIKEEYKIRLKSNKKKYYTSKLFWIGVGSLLIGAFWVVFENFLRSDLQSKWHLNLLQASIIIIGFLLVIITLFFNKDNDFMNNSN